MVFHTLPSASVVMPTASSHDAIPSSCTYLRSVRALATAADPISCVSAAARVLGTGSVAAAVPLLQPLALSAATRRATAGQRGLLARTRSAAAAQSVPLTAAGLALMAAGALLGLAALRSRRESRAPAHHREAGKETR